MLNEADRGRSKCIRCETCDGFPCLVQAKSDAHVCCVEPALARPNVTLLTNAKVTRLHTDATGRIVTKVSVDRNGVPEEYSAGIVVVAAGAINSAALLLRSASDKHPRGLANGSDTVGRHYMGHVNSVVLAVSKCPNPTVFQKTLAINDFYFASKEWEYPMGHISFVGKLDGVALSAGAPAIAPGLHARPDGEALARLLADVRGPAGSEQPRHARPRRQHRPRLRAEQRDGAREAARDAAEVHEQAAQVRDARGLRATSGSSRATCFWPSAYRWPESRTRTARSASGATRRRRRST